MYDEGRITLTSFACGACIVRNVLLCMRCTPQTWVAGGLPPPCLAAGGSGLTCSIFRSAMTEIPSAVGDMCCLMSLLPWYIGRFVSDVVLFDISLGEVVHCIKSSSRCAIIIRILYMSISRSSMSIRAKPRRAVGL